MPHSVGRRVAIIGMGRIGTAIARGYLLAGASPEDLIGTVKRAESVERVKAQVPIRVTTDNSAAADADVVVLAVKPRQAFEVLEEIKPSLGPDQLMISVVAGVPLQAMEGLIPCRIIRAMPNIGIIKSRGVTVISKGIRASDDDVNETCGVFKSLGKCYVMDESYMNAVTSLSGSGPAFIAMVMDAMQEAGVLIGLPSDISWMLVMDTLESTLELLRDYEPASLMRSVATPGGVTINGIWRGEERGLRGTIMDMIEATNRKGAEISRELMEELKRYIGEELGSRR
ncbi:pyrroline-5-carboxylate reductase [Thermocladium modestius]|uniref:Pyrroline-5-carboxylate reductase n=1 Tax=Thermocladium modestius TaxID=62609 RepID=A0A830GVQ8_9CREN|nr:pyrroline-5-carboxylate reductase [Thermocladium modestius]